MSVEITSRVQGEKVSIRRVRKTAQRILALLEQSRSELSLALVDNDQIRKLNDRYRHKPEPTDVLSFPAGESLSTGAKILGDVVISVEQAERQAKRRGEALEQEVERLMIHGILHLLGYDHERSAKEAKIMRRMERKISRALCERRSSRV
jgi:probable rRNA maturation factor